MWDIQNSTVLRKSVGKQKANRAPPQKKRKKESWSDGYLHHPLNHGHLPCLCPVHHHWYHFHHQLPLPPLLPPLHHNAGQKKIKKMKSNVDQQITTSWEIGLKPATEFQDCKNTRYSVCHYEIGQNFEFKMSY